MTGCLGWICLDAIAQHPAPVVGTLGPGGTSGELAAELLWNYLCGDVGGPSVKLYPTYELAEFALRAGEVTHLVVPSTHDGIHQLHADPALVLAGAFIMDSAPHGIARGRGPVPCRPVVARHSSQSALLDQLLPDCYRPARVLDSRSTSAAAITVREGAADLALTTEPAARRHGLEFVSPTRKLRLLCSVFVNRPPSV
jgi:hypothetical protein